MRFSVSAWVAAIGVLLLLLSPSLFLFGAPGMGTTKGGLVDAQLVIPVILLNALFLAAVLGISRRLWLGILFLLPLLLWLPAEWFYLWKFGGATTAQSFGVITETDAAEALSWIGKSGLVALALAALWAVAMCGLVIQLRRTGTAWRHWSANVFGLLLPALIAASAAWGAHELSADEVNFSSDDSAWRDMLDESRAGWTETLAASYPLGMFVRAHDYWRHRNLLKEATLAGRPLDAKQLPSTVRRQVFVFVVGESLRADHLQVNGYPRETTPRLAARNVVSLKDYVSASSSTRVSVPTYFVRPTEEPVSSGPVHLLLDGLREAGFRTYWLSTQAPFGRFDSPISVVARRADEVRFVNPGDYRQRGIYDDQLLAPLTQILARGEPRVFIVLHTLGAHADYRYRYPESSVFFKPVLGSGKMSDPWDPAQREHQVNAYDNAVRYADLFLDKVMGLLEQQDAQTWLFYASDHGETLFDGQCGQSGHGFPSTPNHRAAVLFWYSTSYAAGHRDAIVNLRSHEGLRSDYSAIMPTLLDLADVRTPKIVAVASLASSGYRAADARLVQPGGGRGVVDFDRELRGVDCAGSY